VRPVRVDIVTYAPTVFLHCRHCEVAFDQLGVGSRLRNIEADESLPLDLQLDYLVLSEWVHNLHERHGPSVAIRVIDAASLQGVWTSWRHRVRSYPAVIVGGREKWVGQDYRELDPVIDRMVADEMSKGGSTR
jgi:hypothetical protein